MCSNGETRTCLLREGGRWEHRQTQTERRMHPDPDSVFVALVYCRSASGPGMLKGTGTPGGPEITLINSANQRQNSLVPAADTALRKRTGPRGALPSIIAPRRRAISPRFSCGGSISGPGHAAGEARDAPRGARHALRSWAQSTRAWGSLWGLHRCGEAGSLMHCVKEA